MKNKFWKTCLCLVLSLFGTACKSQTNSITYGCAGGFTGGGSGVKIISDGRILKWTSTIDKISEQELRTDTDFTAEAFSRLEELNIMKVKYEQVGNFTCTLTLNKNDDSHSISWSNNQEKKIERFVHFSNWLEKMILNK